MFKRTPSDPSPDQNKPNATGPTPESPDDGGLRISQNALRTLAKCAVLIVSIWAAVELAKQGVDPAVLGLILKNFRV
ncbi:hypothetical protein [Nonomuraea sp. NPDC049309]|uniref:hypothetical protein n=1 Tax=Nonomuraea sp. NPDC049309 TaxID=3364350 RepID=UPI00371D03C1